ncbi:PEP-CTERM sorting domain-containing protein [Hahella sp. NBU794]|uniref:PEP-CTERM sorting domain-containing protein n=1 Tax=Hahella sp. NBU794 TaxID=3422590 RepID=UPI003D6F26C8
MNPLLKQLSQSLAPTMFALCALPASATVINIDFTANNAETAYVGADGALSTGGAHWNPVAVGDSPAFLRDEQGRQFDASVAWTDHAGDVVYHHADGNELSNSGVGAAPDAIDGINRVFFSGASFSPYQLTIYGTDDLRFALLTAYSEIGYAPDAPNSRYRADGAWGDGIFYQVDFAEYPVDGSIAGAGDTFGLGFGFAIFEGAITGLQVAGEFTPFDAGEPHDVPEPAAWALLSLGLLGAGVRKAAQSKARTAA